MRIAHLIITLLFLALAPLQTLAETPEEPHLLDTFEYKYGIIDLPNNLAQLNVTEEFRYIGPADTQRFLEEGWGNPDGSGTEGMLLPVDVDLFGPEGWGVVITYQDDGYVPDEDASSIDYTEMLEDMREAEDEANKQRAELGYEPIHLVGWAMPPHYDADANKLYWAKELKFGQSQENTLNYNIRILGREGVLVMNAVSDMSQAHLIADRMEQVLGFSEFKDGHRYADYNSGVDKVAAYGIGALVAGKVAAKVGILAKLTGLLLAFKKFIIIGIAAVGSILAKVFRGKKSS